MSKPAAIILAVLVVVAAFLHSRLISQSTPVAAPPGAHTPRVLQEVATLPAELRESSGLAISRTQPGVLWSHNDSGDGPNLYAIDSMGHLLATIAVTGASARDWEDMAAGPCPAALSGTASQPDRARQACLFIGDIGDNDRVRQEVTVYVVVEPVVTGSPAPATVASRSFRFRYPTQPEDSEALAVLPNGDVMIVSKGRTGTIDIFGLAADRIERAFSSGELLTADYRGNTGITPDSRGGRLVTAAAVSPDGQTLAVRTYHDVFFFGHVSGDARAGSWNDLGRGCFLDDAEPQGEAIDYLDADTLLLTSETTRSRPGTIHRLQC